MKTRRRTRPAEERLRRLLVMLPWLMERESVPLAEVAERFGLGEDEVAADLELVAMCGLPPFVDELIDVFIDEGTVYVGVPRLFTRPLRLNSPEAFELLVAGRAAMQLPGADPEGPLGRGLDKLAAALGDDLGLDAVTVDLDRPELADRLAAAAARGERQRLTYWSASSDELSQRVVTPRRVITDRGNWYLDADDDRTGRLRTFRIDRIEAVEPTGEVVAGARTGLPEPGRWFEDSDVPRALVRLAPDAQWIVERYPVDEVGEPDADGNVVVSLPVASRRWLERVLVRLGSSAEVLEPAELRSAGRGAAARVLARYRAP